MPSIPKERGEDRKEHKVFRDFGGINTQPARQAIKDTEFYWLENIMPIGFANAKVVPAQTSTLATHSGTGYYYKAYNINGISYIFVAVTSGACYQVLASSPYTITTIAGASTFSGTSTQIAQWKNDRILIIDSNANGYRGWDGATLTTLSGTTSAPAGGTCISTFSGRVWISSGRTLYYSAPASYTDFTGASAGGNTIITDETLSSNINQLLSANNFLYFFGDDSINVIADVRVSGSSTIYSNTNLTASIGSNYPYSTYAYYRAIWFANKSGIYSMYGATPKKVSDELDGIFTLIDFTKPFSAGSCYIYNILCMAFSFTYNDPSLGARPILAVYFSKKWFISTQGSTLKFVWTNNISGVDFLYGSDGTNIYQCFGNTTGTVSWKMITKLYDDGVPYQDKQVLKFGLEVVLPASVSSLSATIDSERQTQAYTLASTSLATWINNSGATVLWQNNSSAIVNWLAGGYTWFRQDVSMVGHYYGVTITSSTPAFLIEGMMWQTEKRSLWGS
jgi:hypothetical protein